MTLKKKKKTKHQKPLFPPSSFGGQPRSAVCSSGTGGSAGAGLLLTFPLRVPSQLARLEQRHMKYDDFLLKRRRRGRGREDRSLPMGCMPGAAQRTGPSGAAAPGDGPLLPAP